MTEQTQRLEKALDGCAERGISPTPEPWAEIEGRLEARSTVFTRRPRRFLLRTRVALALATALVLAGTSAYATGGVMDALDSIFGDTVPYVKQHDLSTPIDVKESDEGVTVSVDRVYADSDYVAVGYTVEGLDKIARRYGSKEGDVSAWMRLHDVRVPEEGDPDGTTYDSVDGSWWAWSPGAETPAPPRGAEAATVVFRASNRLEPGEEHRLRAEVFFDGPTGPVPTGNGSYETERLGHPIFVDIRVPVSDVATVIRVNRTVEANGVPITLTRVVNSPVKTSAYLCFEPPQRKYDWPLVKTRIFEEGRMADAPVYHIDYAGAEEGCAEYTFDRPLYGRSGAHSLTVSELLPSRSDEAGSVRGPWRFTFEIPEARLDP